MILIFNFFLFIQMGYIAEFIKSLASRSQLVAHQLLWNMKTNMFKDEDSLIKDGNELNRLSSFANL